MRKPRTEKCPECGAETYAIPGKDEDYNKVTCSNPSCDWFIEGDEMRSLVTMIIVPAKFMHKTHGRIF